MFETRNRLFWPAMASLAAVAVAGCHPSTDGGQESPPPATEVATARFNPTTGALPYPIDLYFAPSAAAPVPDGTINMPASLSWHSYMLPAVNTLDGWSTTASLDTSFTLPLDATSIGASTVKIVKLWVNPSNKGPVNPADAAQAAYLPDGATSPVAGILTYGTDFTADISDDIDSGGKILRITPLKPFDYSKGPYLNSGANAGKVLNVGYLVILTNGLKATSGVAVTPDTLYADIKAASSCSTFTNATQNAICQLTKAHLGIAQATGTNPADIVLSWGFSTQSIDDTFAIIAATSAPTQTVVVPTGLDTKQASGGALAGYADVYVGSTKLPYYLTPADFPGATPADNILRKFWTAANAPNPAFGLDAASRNLTMFNPIPLKVADVTVPLLVTIPKAPACAGMPAGGWPVAIVQHGITRNRSDALAMSDGFAGQCFIVAAIDMPLHGITDTTSPLYCDSTKPQCVGATERTFNVDLVNNTTSAAAADGVIDSSGTHFINLVSPLTARDNNRQASADLITFAKSITTLATPAGPIQVNASRISFVGASLGAMVGTAATEFSPQLTSSTLADAGGLITKLLNESSTFGPRIRAGLSAQLVLDSYTYNLFLRDFQAALDSGDPINHIRNAQLTNPVHMMNVQNDALIPASAAERLYLAGGITKLTTLGPNAVGAGTGAYAWFSKGGHGSIFSPAVGGLDVTTEMQTQTIGFAATSVGVPGGPFVVLTNPAVLDLN